MVRFVKTRIMNALLLVLVPVLILKSIISLVGPNWDTSLAPVIVLLLATAGVTYSALGRSSPRQTTLAVYLNYACLVFSAAGVAATLNYMSSAAGVLGSLALLIPWAINLKALYTQRDRSIKPGPSPAPGKPSGLRRHKRLVGVWLVLTIGWFGLLFYSVQNENNNIRVSAASQKAYNTWYEDFRVKFDAEIEAHVRATCTRWHTLGVVADVGQCGQVALAERKGLGYPTGKDLCAIIKRVRVDSGPKSDNPYIDAGSQSGQEAEWCNFPTAPTAPLREQSLFGNLRALIIPPVLMALALGLGSFAFHRFRILEFARGLLAPRFALRNRIGFALFAGYELWLCFWVLVIARGHDGMWLDNYYWLRDWIVLAVTVPAGALISFALYRWAFVSSGIAGEGAPKDGG